VVPAGAARVLRRSGHEVLEVRVGDVLRLGGEEVRVVPAVHDGRRHPLAPPVAPVGYVVGGRHGVYFAGDTELFDGMAQLAGGLRVALVPIWGWGPRLGPGHMDPEQAARALALLRPAIAVPIHWGTFLPWRADRTHAHRLVEPARAFAEHAARLAPGVRVEVPAPGEWLTL
jgi:L-ascorbate metabolism protein UlaG (beta-lactamase superfamily)